MPEHKCLVCGGDALPNSNRCEMHQWKGGGSTVRFRGRTDGSKESPNDGRSNANNPNRSSDSGGRGSNP